LAARVASLPALLPLRRDAGRNSVSVNY
jgi:hypothetical protein